MASNAQQSTRIASLDTLRGVAIGLVLMSHFLSGRAKSPAFDEFFVGLGRAGVTLFFLLSGYLIFKNVQVQPLLVFMSRRCFKILPSFWINILVILFCDLMIKDFPHYPPRLYVASAMAVSDLFGKTSVSGVYWTLLIEIKFYAFIALQFTVLRDRYLLCVPAILILLEGLAWLLQGRGSQTLAYFSVFYVGIAVYRAEQSGWSRRSMTHMALVVTTLCVSLMCFLDTYSRMSAIFLLLDAFFLLLVLKCRLSNVVWSRIGLASYSNYLYHSLVAAAVFKAWGEVSGFLGTGVVLATACAATLITSELLYRGIEAPLARFGRRWERTWVKAPRIAQREIARSHISRSAIP
jgi:peptidoglycan/LPS O-acetylase OafA/YrhL